MCVCAWCDRIMTTERLGTTVTTTTGTTTSSTTETTTTGFFINCGNGITAVPGDGSDCALLWEDVVALDENIVAMIDSGSYLTSLQDDFSTLFADITAITLAEAPTASYFDDVDADAFGAKADAVVVFSITLAGVAAIEVDQEDILQDLGNAIADNCGLPWNSPSMFVDVPTSRMRGRVLADSTNVNVGITLPIIEPTTTTLQPYDGACLLKQGCNDGVKNGDEEFVDCGGSCTACLPTCSDGEKNGNEEDVDCGGDDCSECPIDCEEAWADYGDCSTTCGTGTKTRTWTVSVDAQYGGTNCTNEAGASDTAACATDDFVVADCPVDCVGAWGSWGTCTRTCGRLGMRTRTFAVSVDVAAGGVECDNADEDEEVEECNTDSVCPIDCEGEWTNWKCEATCGTSVTGVRTFVVSKRSRFGGADCSVDEDAVESDTCPFDCCDQSCDATVPPAIPRGVMWATVSGGDSNFASGDYATVTGGQKNRAEAMYVVGCRCA